MAGPLGSTPGIIVGVGVGAATSVALQPAVEIPRQKAWQDNPNRILDVNLLARLVAEGGVELGAAQDEAKRDGFAPDKLDALVYLAQTVPGVAEALDLWRRGFISDAEWTHSLIKQGFDARYLPALNELKHAELLGLGDIAFAVVRGILPTPSWVPVAPPTHTTKVPRFPVVDVDPVALAEKLGFTEEMLQIMVGRSGLSMAPGLAAQANFRGIIADDDYLLAIAEGDLRTEWGDALKEASRQILTAGEYAELQLRGFIDAPTRRTLTAKHGMTNADSDHLFNVLGRAPAVHQITTGLARGGEFNGPTGGIPEVYLSAIQRSNTRPEYYNIAYANRYSYPSGFQIRGAAQAGELTEAETEEILLEVGWSPKWAKFFAAAWTGGTGTTADPSVKKAESQLWTTLHRSFVAEESDAAVAETTLDLLGVPQGVHARILNLWEHERELIRKQLTPAQIKKAYTKAVTNPATNQPWTLDDALAALIDRGYSHNDATTYLNTP